MTDRLYYTDAYLREFAATTVATSDGGRRIYLDRTAFYPTSGGQPHDLGRVNDTPVIDVVDEGDRIAHVLAEPIGADRVTGHVDWIRRFDHMQQHTGQHLLSAVIADLFGYATVSVHFGSDSSTLDLDTAAFTPGQVAEAERRANATIVENRRVEVSFEDAATASGLRKKPEREGTLRIITIHELDRSACGGTHVRATGEIGSVLIRRVERMKKLVRLEFLCGGRAVARARADADLLARLSASFSATPDELPALVDAQRTDLKELRGENHELGERLAVYQAAELYAAAETVGDGRRLIVLREERGPIDRLRTLGQAVARLSGAVFLATVSEPPAVLLAVAADSGMDAGKTLKAALEAVGGRGGGNARLAQGTVRDQAGLDSVRASISESRLLLARAPGRTAHYSSLMLVPPM